MWYSLKYTCDQLKFINKLYVNSLAGNIFLGGGARITNGNDVFSPSAQK